MKLKKQNIIDIAQWVFIVLLSVMLFVQIRDYKKIQKDFIRLQCEKVENEAITKNVNDYCNVDDYSYDMVIDSLDENFVVR